MAETKLCSAMLRMYPAHPSVGWSGWRSFRRPLTMCVFSLHRLPCVGRPSCGGNGPRALVTASVEYLTILRCAAVYSADNGVMSGKLGWRDSRWATWSRSEEGRDGIAF